LRLYFLLHPHGRPIHCHVGQVTFEKNPTGVQNIPRRGRMGAWDRQFSMDRGKRVFMAGAPRGDSFFPGAVLRGNFCPGLANPRWERWSETAWLSFVAVKTQRPSGQSGGKTDRRGPLLLGWGPKFTRCLIESARVAGGAGGKARLSGEPRACRPTEILHQNPQTQNAVHRKNGKDAGRRVVELLFRSPPNQQFTRRRKHRWYSLITPEAKPTPVGTRRNKISCFRLKVREIKFRAGPLRPNFAVTGPAQGHLQTRLTGAVCFFAGEHDCRFEFPQGTMGAPAAGKIDALAKKWPGAGRAGRRQARRVFLRV